MDIATKKHLLHVVDSYLFIVPDLKEVTLSYRIFGDSKKLAALRGDADITLGRYAAAMTWLAANWPEGHVMPAHLVPYIPTPAADLAPDLAAQSAGRSEKDAA